MSLPRLKGSRLLFRVLLCMVAGGVSALAFAPLAWGGLIFPCLAVLFASLRVCHSRWHAGVLGFCWGFGAFAVGISWLHVALVEFGNMPFVWAILAIGLFAAYLAIYPALAAATWYGLRTSSTSINIVLFGAAWGLGEWLRGGLFSGFPWLAVGYSQLSPSPLQGFFPLIGVYGVGFITAALAAAAVELYLTRRRRVIITMMVLTLCTGLISGVIQWTHTVGKPLTVALVQTNIAQSLKWNPDYFDQVLALNARLAISASSAQLTVLPETTLPVMRRYLPPDYLPALKHHFAKRGTTLILGLFMKNAQQQIMNSAISVHAGVEQRYAKSHLVPFGEYSPPLFGWFYRWVDIPMSNQTPGATDQPLMTISGQKIGVNICYEDVFGQELLRQLPEATILLNLSNLAWYGESWAQPQHLQIARARALETGRPILRSTNTGMTAVIQPDGTVTRQLPAFTEGVLNAKVPGYQGVTPYSRWGDRLIIGLMCVILIVGLMQRQTLP